MVNKSAKMSAFILTAVLHTFGISWGSHLQRSFVLFCFYLQGCFERNAHHYFRTWTSVSLSTFSSTVSPSAAARTSSGIMKLALIRTIQGSSTEQLLRQKTFSRVSSLGTWTHQNSSSTHFNPLWRKALREAGKQGSRPSWPSCCEEVSAEGRKQEENSLGQETQGMGTKPVATLSGLTLSTKMDETIKIGRKHWMRRCVSFISLVL